MNRQKQILAVALLLLVLSVSWAYVKWPRQKTVPELKYAPGQQAAPAGQSTEKKPAAQDDGRVLNLSQLDREYAFNGYLRNIFKPFGMQENTQINVVKPVLPPPPPPVPIVPAVEPQRELAKFTFIGFLKTGDRRTVFLTKDKDEIMLVKAGDTFAGRYKAVQITDKMLTIKVLDGDEEIIVPLNDSH